MAIVVYSGVLVVVSMFVMAQAYFPVRQPNYFCGSYYDSSCRESIEDLKALLEITQSLKQDNNNYSCSTCATTFSEEVIMKLVNALIYTATHNCGYSSGGGGYYPGGSNNVGGGNAAGGLIGGGNTIGVLSPVTGGVNTGVVNPGGTAGETSKGGSTGKTDGGLIDLGVLTGDNTLSLGLGGTKVLGVDVGKQSGSKDGESKAKSSTASEGNSGDGLIQLGVLNKDNSLANVGIAGQTLLNVALGKDHKGNDEAGGTYPTNSGTTAPTTTPAVSSPVNTGPVSNGSTLPAPTTSGLDNGVSNIVPINNGPGGKASPVSNHPVAGGGSILPNNSDNLGGVTNPTNAGDVNQVNQEVNKVTNVIPTN